MSNKTNDELVYCIEHEKMVEVFTSPYAPLTHSFWVPVDNEPNEAHLGMFQMEYCDFNQGYAYCPPPPFDLEAYIAENGSIPLVIEQDFKAYDYDVETDQIVEVLL